MCAWNGERIKPKTKLIHKKCYLGCLFFYCLLSVINCFVVSTPREKIFVCVLYCYAPRAENSTWPYTWCPRNCWKSHEEFPRQAFGINFLSVFCGVTLKSLRETLWTNPESWASVGTWEFITSSLVLCLYPNSVSVIWEGGTQGRRHSWLAGDVVMEEIALITSL